MKIVRFYPTAQLSPLIDHFWMLESEKDEVIQLPILLPGTGAELYFHYKLPFRYQIRQNHPITCESGHLFCIRNTPINLLPSSNIGFLAVRFKAGMIDRFTKIRAKELLDKTLSVEEIWGTSGKYLLKRLAYTQTSLERIVLIQDFLIQHLKNESSDVTIEKAISILYKQDCSISIQNLAETLSLSRRQLERRFKLFSGQSPANFKSIKRFQHTVRKLILDDTEKPLDVALEHGYFDQSHLIRDFQHLAGTTPNRYLVDARTKTHFYNTRRSKIDMIHL